MFASIAAPSLDLLGLLERLLKVIARINRSVICLEDLNSVWPGVCSSGEKE